ncbi:ANTAR domain-containing protein [Blastopirellula retiformator]|uniref:Ethylene receptor 1-like N-terminal domain-containing protein n=1 Tax=Blastopirellula retiformator TaxID=2527970 RepID=A0A5C5VL92_9BACT|nr:hypothetical protein [Blastopirellula retiformator]TWT38811.1 hypothetical protein Enr8_05050 [Blastopirellula retiformator]
MNSLVRIFAWTLFLAICLAQGAPSWSAEPEPASCCAKPSSDANREFQADTFSRFFTKLFDGSDYPARWYCGNWTLETGWLHVISDIAIFGAYFTIPVVLLCFLRQRPDIPFPKIIWLFAAFIFACGFGHLVEAGISWWPVYRFSGLIKALTAAISWATVLVLIRLTPEVLKLPSMAILGQQLQIANHRLDGALEAGCSGYLTKPLGREELLRTVAVALHEYREQQAEYKS